MREHRFGAAIVGAAIVAATLSVASTARSEDDTCSRSIAASDALRASGRLIDARRRLADCSVASCMPGERSTCVHDLAEVAEKISSIAVRVQTWDGRDVNVDSISVDGVDETAHAAQGSIEVDPGSHSLVVQPREQPVQKLTITVGPGQKMVPVAVRISAERERNPTSGGGGPAGTGAPPGGEPARGPVSPLAYVTGGIAVLAGLSWAVFGIKAATDYSALQDCRPNCDSSRVSTGKTESLVADISAPLTVVAAAATVVLILIRPTLPARVTAEPMGMRGAGATFAVGF